jgi:glycosyltransferase involved in cell wall biosynthesis
MARGTSAHHSGGQPEYSGPADAEPYFLYVGGRDEYKDFPVLLAALAEMKDPPRPHLFAVGGGKWSRSESAAIVRLGLTDRVTHVTVDDEELRGYYAHALALVVTARAEGFGLPVLEAMASGCPVISSSGGALPEVAGGAALHFEPGNAAQLVDHLRATAKDGGVRQELIRAGRRRASEFSWEATARALAEVYRGLPRE